VTTEIATINRKTQIGDESTPGTAVPADKLLENLNVSIAPKPDVKMFGGSGRRWNSVAVMNRDWTELKLDGNLDYQDFVYLIAGCWGIMSPATHAGGTLSKDWTWTPPVTGAITPRTYTIEQGDTTRAQSVAYGLMTGFSYKGNRTNGFTCEGKMIARNFSDSITLTATPTSVALSPVVGVHVDLWINTTSAALGTTQFTRAFNFEYSYESAFNDIWPLNRSIVSFAGHVDTKPKNTVKILLEMDSAGMGLYTHIATGDYLYVRFDAQGPIIETTIPYTITHDMALKIKSVSEFKDTDGGVYAIEYECDVMEDPAWGAAGQSQIMTVTNLLSTL
jgi:hypothetical protein